MKNRTNDLNGYMFLLLSCFFLVGVIQFIFLIAVSATLGTIDYTQYCLIWSALALLTCIRYIQTNIQPGTTQYQLLLVVIPTLMIASGSMHYIATHNDSIVAANQAADLAAKEAAVNQAAFDKHRADYLATLPQCRYEVHHINIYSLERKSEITGSISGSETDEMGGVFILGFGGVSGSSSSSISGSIGEKMSYYFYKDTNDGGVVLDSVPATVRIYEKNDTQPQLVWVDPPPAQPYGVESCYGLNDTIDDYHGLVFATKTHGGWHNTMTYTNGEKIVTCNDGTQVDSETKCGLDTVNSVRLIVPIGTIKQQFAPN